MKDLKTLELLPKELDVKVSRNPETGIWLAKIQSLDIFTEADDLIGLIYNVNDLIYAFFDISKRLQHKVWYMPPYFKENIIHKPKVQLNELMRFNILLSPQLHHNYFH